MLTAVLLAAAFAPAADDVSLDDIKRFTNEDRAQLKSKWEATRYFGLFLQDLRRNAGDEKRKRQLEAEIKEYRTTEYTYRYLYRLEDPNEDKPAKLATLRSLRFKIGDAAYKAGGMPP